MPPAEVPPPQNAVRGKHRIYATDERGWKKLCESRPNDMIRAYAEIANNPFPRVSLPRHHKLHGLTKKLGGDHWEYEVGGGERIRYKAGPSGEIVVVYAGPAPSDTH